MSTLNAKIIMGSVVMDLIDAGYRVAVCDQAGGGLRVYAVPDGGHMPDDGGPCWVKFSQGNTNLDEIISDYTTNLEDVLAPTLILASGMGGT